jgi:hypothetical protein
MKSRRRIAASRPNSDQLNQGFAASETGSAVKRHGSNFAWRSLMSALPPKADIAERDRHVRFVPILLQKSAVTRAWRLSRTS